MKYIRTKDGRIIDVEKFIDEEKENPYYTDYKFEEIKNEKDCCSIHWTAIGTEENSQKDQIGRRCQFGATIKSPFIKQADTIEELVDEYVAKKDCSRPFVIKKYEIYSNLQFGFTIYGSIWVDGEVDESWFGKSSKQEMLEDAAMQAKESKNA